ncbi:MAG: R3H domain-containing nucleic acid-binding protein [Anaerolineae bacterium]
MERRITDDLTTLLSVLPSDIAEVIEQIGRNDDLLEIILDLGRVPTARYTDGEYVLIDREVQEEDLESVVMQLGDFDADNRAGIERTLHRISGIRNRRGEIVGLTCRIGRAVFGTIEIIRDIVQGGKSILMLGKPGVGKTTMLREAARVLAQEKRVVIVDTSNEIGGDGDIPHQAIGKSRRMQVPTPNLQHEVMIEAVENHNPEVIIIDEIGRELEALAARTIAERGVQLIGTAHGITLDNLLLNPTLSDLVGGIESVTLSDEEARRRGTQKTVLERRSPPTFDVLIELQDRNTLVIHHDVAYAVDMSLRGKTLQPEVRIRQEDGTVKIEEGYTPPQREARASRNGMRGSGKEAQPTPQSAPAEVSDGIDIKKPKKLKPVHVYPYGIARNRLMQSAKDFGVPLYIVVSLDQAEILLTHKNFYRRRPRINVDAEQRGLPIYVLRSNTIAQMESFLVDQFGLELDGSSDDLVARALNETREGIEAVLAGAESIDLTPQTAYIRKLQHEIVRDANLISHSYGKEPNRHIRIFRG